MGTIVSTIVQTVEHYFMQFNVKPLSESRKSPIQVSTTFCYIVLILFYHYN